uniref:Lipid-binding serum glycoprotein N-terminal domain-containing protein n=1 Tax=Wuchereria bancrofti TaxID=6293 RepID=A0AAF5PQG1_WUCBA
MRVQFLLLAQVFISYSSSEITLRARFNQKILSFSASFAKDVLQNRMKTLALPSQTVSFGAGSAEIKKLKVESFESPDIRISLVAPNGLIFSTSGGSIAISGSWNAAYRILWTMYISGDLSVKISGIKTLTRVNLLSQKGKLQLHFEECRLKIGNLNLKLYGGIGSWIASYFTSGAENDIKRSIEKDICKNVRDNIEHLNKELWSIEAQTNVINNVYLSYHLLEDPKITENFIQFDFSVYATFGRRKCYLQPEGKSINNNRQIMSNHMIVLWFGEPIINCYLKTWYETVNHHHVYISNSTDSRRFRNLFNVNCTKTKNCTGKVSDLNKLDLDIQLIKAPLLHAENGIYIETSMKIVFYRSPKNSDSLKLTELSKFLHFYKLTNSVVCDGD